MKWFRKKEESDKKFMLRLYETRYRLIRYHVQKVVGDTDLVEDLIQDTILDLIPRVRLLRRLEAEQLTVYVVKAARHTALSYIRKLSPLLLDFFPEEKDDNTPLSEWERKETLAEIAEAFQYVPERDWALLYLFYVSGKKPEEICEKVHIRFCSFYQALSRARKNLKAALAKGGELYEDE